jgi:type I restriction enzyme M protein
MSALRNAGHWKDVRTTSKDVGKKLQAALRGIESANPKQLDGIFGDAQWTNKERLPDVTLKNLLEHFSQQTLSLTRVPEDELGNGYEFLIKKFADDSGHTAQEFYTNRTVVQLMVQMLDPRPGERIYDPTCGTGGMLISALAEVKRQGGEHRTLKLFGQERNHMTASIARMNLVLHGVEGSEIARGDTLASPVFAENDQLQTFDVVLANPPYSIKQWNRDAWTSDPWGRNFLGTPPQGRADYAFFQHLLKSMDPKTGRSAVLFPHGVLFRKEEAELRRKLIEADLIECVLGLGPNLFYNSPMEACVVFCRSKKQKKRAGKVLLIDAINEVTRERAISFLTPTHQARIEQAYKAFVDEPGFCKVATREDFSMQNWSLSIPLYVKRPSASTSHAGGAEPTLAEAWETWETSGRMFWEQMDTVVDMLDGLIGSEEQADG